MANELDVHATVYRAKSALHCISQLAGDKKQLHEVQGYGMQCLLELIEQELSDVLEAMGGDPDMIEINVRKDAH